MVNSGGATLSSVSQERCTMRMSMPWEAAVRASAVVERIGMITMVYVGETLLITPYDDIEFGKYKSNEGYLSAKKVVPSVAEYIATNHISVDKMFIRSQDPVMLVRARAQLEQIPGIRVMLNAVALPIAMGNASAAVKNLCLRETLTNAQDGVAAAIDRIIAENG